MKFQEFMNIAIAYSSNIMIVEFSGVHKLYNYDYVNLNGLS